MMSELESVEIEISTTGSSLYFFFGGIVAGIAMPPFEFYNSSKILEHSKIFFRDFNQCWYQNGIPDIGGNIHSIKNYIRKQTEAIKPENIYFVGNSMGGYAAILFAALTGKGEAIAFAPQTFISPHLRLFYGDRRWSRQIINTYKKSTLKRKAWDLKKVLRNSRGKHKISIFVSKDDQLDYIHANRIKNIPCVHIHEFHGGGHGIVKLLRDRGDLPNIMSGSYPDQCS
jgi:hypothetical protein